MNPELTLLSKEEVDKGIEQLEVLKKYGIQSCYTDLAVLTGGEYFGNTKNLKGSTGTYVTRSADEHHYLWGVYGTLYTVPASSSYSYYIRPVLKLPEIFSQVSLNRIKGDNGVEEVEFGYYPQYAAIQTIQKMLEYEYQLGLLQKTGRNYTFNKASGLGEPFEPETYEEYEYGGKRYIRVKANFDYTYNEYKLSNGEMYKRNDYVWVEVSPVKWLIDDKTQTLVSKNELLSGIRFGYKGKDYSEDYSTTDMKEYLDKYMLRDLTQSGNFNLFEDMTPEEKKKFEERLKRAEMRKNPYKLNFNEVSEEEIIRGAIESDVPVFLHGPSSEGKSARVKQIDPTCEIIYLRNATPESLNGKSVYDQATGEMIDIPPTWLKRLQEKCEKEPDKYHILFLDEITNSLPGIQGMAFNIVLDKEVNGIWKLPDNVRIVAAGNEMKDSLAANQIAEPLFNRFAHVYIKTTTEKWLKWASENNIHPAIYSYIAYKNGETLRSKYNGEKPNADPRKWEMASKMLYATKNPEMLRALVGEDITKEFIQFCNQKVITLADVIQDNYIDEDIQLLNTAERYATTMALSQVNEENFEKVREFVTRLGAEFEAIFDSLWSHGDEKRLEIIAEAKLADADRGGIRK